MMGMTEKLIPSWSGSWQKAQRASLYSMADVIAQLRSATSPEFEQLQRQVTERAMEFQRLYMHALDEAALVLLAHGCRDIHRVMRPDGVEELWVDVTPSEVQVGELMPGRCVYRQWTATDMEAGTMSVVKEWTDPELLEAARKFYAERSVPAQ